MNIAITGCCGFLGRNLMNAFPAAKGFDHHDRGYLMFPPEKPGNTDNLDHLTSLEQGRYTKINLLTESPDFSNMDVVIHLAARTSVRSVNKVEPVPYNLALTQMVYRAASEYKVPLLLNASSSSVYGNGPTPFREDQLPQPLSEYGLYKAVCEMWLNYAALSGHTKVMNFRLFNLLGKYQRQDMLPMTALQCLDSSSTPSTPVPLFGRRFRAWTPVTQVVDTLRQLMDLPVTGRTPCSTTVNIGGTWVCDQERLLGLLGEVLDLRSGIPFEYTGKEYPTEAVRTEADPRRLLHITGYPVFTTEYAIKEALREVVTWHRAPAN